MRVTMVLPHPAKPAHAQCGRNETCDLNSHTWVRRINSTHGKHACIAQSLGRSHSIKATRQSATDGGKPLTSQVSKSMLRATFVHEDFREIPDDRAAISRPKRHESSRRAP